MRKIIHSIVFFSLMSLTQAQTLTYNFVKEISGVTQNPPQYGFYNPQGIASDSEDNMYVVDRENNLISKFSKDGVLLKRWPVVYPNGIAIDENDKVYITQSGLAVVSVYTSDGAFVRKWGSYGSANYQMKTPYGIVLDSDGNVYVTDVEKDAVIKYANDGTFIKMWGNTGTFTNATGICIDENNHVFVTDQNKNLTVCYDLNGNELQRKSLSGVGIASDKNGFIYICSSNNQTIVKYNAATLQYLETYGTIGSSNAEFYSPCGVIFAKNGKIYTVEGRPTNGNARVQVFNSMWQYLFKWGGTGNLEKQFSRPSSFCKDANGNIYVSDAGNRRVQKLSSNGEFLSNFSTERSLKSIAIDNDGNIWGAYDQVGVKKYSKDGVLLSTWNKNFGSDNGQIYDINNIEIDADNNVYTIDYLRVQKFNAQGDFIMKFDLNESSKNPRSLAFDPITKDVFISAYTYPNAPKIYRFSKSGTFLSSWSLPASVSYLSSIVIANDNKLYISDNSRHKILTYSLDGTFLSSFGEFGCDPGKLGGVSDMFLDTNLNIYVLEGSTGNSGITVEETFGTNDRIQIFEPENPISTAIKNQNAQSVSDVLIYPNPSNGLFNVNCTFGQTISKVTLTNTLGQQEYYSTNEITTQLKGLILITIETGDQQVFNSKIIIQ